MSAKHLVTATKSPKKTAKENGERAACASSFCSDHSLLLPLTPFAQSHYIYKKKET